MLGAHVTVAGPPTLVPDEFASLGATVRHSLDGHARGRRRLRAADAARADERRGVPSLREYTSNFQIDSRRLGPRQLADAPGSGEPRHRALRRGDRLQRRR